jgi:uroporphyrinogen decarboxylase
MDKKKRVLAAIEGKMDAVDRPPVSVWYHFGTQFLDGHKAGALEAEFFRYYDWDFLKMMNDYPWPLPAGMTSIPAPADLGRFRRLTMEEHAFRQQLGALKEACRRVGREAFVIDTVFNPFGVARRTLKKNALRFMREAPQAMLDWLEVCAENLSSYIAAAARTGIGGIFFSVNGADAESMTDAEFERFVKPFDLRVLQAARSVGPLLIGHIHGKNLAMDRVLAYPVAALNWSHLRDNEGFASVRRRSSACFIGGMEEAGTSQLTPEEIAESVLAAYRDSSGGGFIAGPGCAVPADISPDLIRAPRLAVETLKKP